jgi:hypothetical protein
MVIEELNNACFVVSDASGQQLAYAYFEEEPGRRSAAKSLSKDEARRIAVNFARLPELPGRNLNGGRTSYGPHQSSSDIGLDPLVSIRSPR